MLGLADSDNNPRVWTAEEVKQLVHKSELPDHWNGSSVITYKLMNHCIEEIKTSKLVMKYKLPEICELLSTSNQRDALSGVGAQTPLQPQQVRNFVVKVKRKMSLGETKSEIVNSKVEFPKSPQGPDYQSRTLAWVNELSSNVGSGRDDATDMVMPEVVLSDEKKMDIERVADEGLSVLVRLQSLMQDMDNTTEKYERGEMEREAYEKAVREFKAAHQRNRVDDHHCKGRIDIIAVCCPIEVENKVLQDQINKKHKELVSEFYEDLLHKKMLACESLQGTSVTEIKVIKEREKIALINSVLGIDYRGEADPVDHAHFVKSFLEYVVGVVPKHVGKSSTGDVGETSGGADHGGQRRGKLIESPEWESSWQRHFEEAAADKKKLEIQEELQKKIGGLKSKVEGLKNELEELRKEEELKRIELNNHLADLRKREHESDSEVVRVPRKKMKKKEKRIPIFTGKEIAHLYQNKEHVRYFMEDDFDDPGAMTWMDAVVLGPVLGQDLSNPEQIMYRVKYKKLDEIFKLTLGKDYLDGRIIVRGEESESSDEEFDELTLGEVKKQARERMMELQQNKHKKRSKKRPEPKKSIPNFTGMKLRQCFDEDKDNVPLSKVQEEIWNENNSESYVSAIRWMDATVLGPVPNQNSSDPYHTVYRVKYDELNEVYEVDLGKDYLKGNLICSDFSSSDPEPDELPLEEVLKEAKGRMAAFKRSATGDAETSLEEKRQKVHHLSPADKEENEDVESTIAININKESDKKENENKMTQKTPEELARKNEIKQLKDKILSLSCLETKRASFRDKRWKEKVKSKSEGISEAVRKRRERLFDEAVQRLCDTRRELDGAKKRLEELGEVCDSYNESDDDDFVRSYSRKKKYRSASEEKKQKRRDQQSEVSAKIEKLEKLYDEKREISKHLYAELRIAEDEDRKAKEAANVNYWLSSPSKEVKEKRALLDSCEKERDETFEEIDTLYDRYDELNSSASDVPKNKKSNKSSADILHLEDVSSDTASDGGTLLHKVTETNVKVLEAKKGSDDTESENEEETSEKEMEEEEVPEQVQKDPEVIELESKIAKLKTRERTLSSKRKQLAGAVTALKDFEKWQASSSRKSRRSTESTRDLNTQSSAELTKKQALYFKTLQNLVDIRKEIRPLLKKLKEVGGELDSDWSDDDECMKDWITKGERSSEEQMVSVQTDQMQADDGNQVNEMQRQTPSTDEVTDQQHQVLPDMELKGASSDNAQMSPLLVDENKNEITRKMEMIDSTCPVGSTTECVNFKTSVTIKDEFKVEKKEAMDIKPTRASMKSEVKHLKSDMASECKVEQDQCKINLKRALDAELVANQGKNNSEDMKAVVAKTMTQQNAEHTETIHPNQNVLAKREIQKADRAKLIAERQSKRAEEKERKRAAAEALDKRIDQIKRVVKHRDTINWHRWDEYLLQKRLEDKTCKASNIDFIPSDELTKIEQLSIFASQSAKAASAELKELRRRRNQIVISDSESSEESSEESSSSEEDPEDECDGEVSSDEDTSNEEVADQSDMPEERQKKVEIKQLRRKIISLKKIEQSKDNRRKQRWKEVKDEEDFQQWIKSSRRCNRKSAKTVTKPEDSTSEPTKNDLYDLALKHLIETRKEIYALQKRLKELGAEVTLESDWIDDGDGEDEEQWITRGAVINSEVSNDIPTNDGTMVDGEISTRSGSSAQETQVNGSQSKNSETLEENSCENETAIEEVEWTDSSSTSKQINTTQNDVVVNVKTCSKDTPSTSEQVDGNSNEFAADQKTGSRESDGKSENIVVCKDTDQTNSMKNGEDVAVHATVSGKFQMNIHADVSLGRMDHEEKAFAIEPTMNVSLAETPDDDITILPSAKKQVEIVDLTDKAVNSETNMDEEVQNQNTEKIEEKRKAKEIKEQKRTEVAALEERIVQLKQLQRQRTTISVHHWDEFELQKHIVERANNTDSAGTTHEFSSDNVKKMEELSVLASQRAEDVLKEIQAVRRKKNQIVISDSESSEEDSTEDEEDSSEEESSDAEDSSNGDENSSNDNEEPLSLDKRKEARRKELQDKFSKLSTLHLKRMNLKWKYYKELQTLKNSKYAASLTNIIKKKEKLYEGAVQRLTATSEEYDQHWKLMKEELSDYASSGEDSSK